MAITDVLTGSVSGQMLIVLILLLSNAVRLELFHVQECGCTHLHVIQRGRHDHMVKGKIVLILLIRIYTSITFPT